MQYHSKATHTVCSIELKREEFLYIRAIVNFQAECVLIYMLLFCQISAWVFLIHMFVYARIYCNKKHDDYNPQFSKICYVGVVVYM